jgi:dihydrofolate reductase
MRKIILGMMMSLDGYAAGPNDEMDWLPAFDDESMWRDAHEEMWNVLDSVDTVLLGRRTYQIWEKYWPAAGKNPSSSKNDLRFSRFADETQKIVFSNTLKKVEWRNSRLVSGDISDEVLRLKGQPGKEIALAGGPGLARTFTDLGLVDEYRITVHPVILGKGKSLFAESTDRLRLRLVRTRPLRSGAVLLHYETVRSG